MAVVFSETFDGATSGTLNPPGWTPLGGYGQYSTAQKVNGSAAYFSGTSQAYLQRSTGATQNKRFIRLYFRRETVSTDANNCSFAVLYDTAGSPNAVARLGFVSNTGNLMVRDGGTHRRAVSDHDRAVVPGRLVRGGRYRATGPPTPGRPCIREHRRRGRRGHPASPNRRIHVGRLQHRPVLRRVPACNFYIDEVAVDNAALPAPFAPPATGRPRCGPAARGPRNRRRCGPAARGSRNPSRRGPAQRGSR